MKIPHQNIFDDFEKVSSITPPQTTTGTSPAVVNLTNSSDSAVKVMVTDGSDEQKTTEEDLLTRLNRSVSVKLSLNYTGLLIIIYIIDQRLLK